MTSQDTSGMPEIGGDVTVDASSFRTPLLDPVAQKLLTYYRSIETGFHETLEKAGSDDDESAALYWAMFSGLGLMLSVIPLLPSVAYVLSQRFLRPRRIAVHHFALSTNTLLFWYVALCLVFSVILVVSARLERRAEARKKRERESKSRLSGRQMRFALCFATRLEIEAFLTNKRDVHKEKAKELWKPFMTSLDYGFTREDTRFHMGVHLRPDSFYFEFSPRRRRFDTPFAGVLELCETLPWFKLEPRTSEVVTAFTELVPKLGTRLRDSAELNLVSGCLLPLCIYLYLRIPEVDTSVEGFIDAIPSQEEILRAFAARVTTLPPYVTEESNGCESRAKAQRRRIGLFVERTFASRFAIVRFASIWASVQLIVAISVEVAIQSLHYLRLDSTLIALLIGSPLAIAAALTAVPPENATRHVSE